MGLNCFRTYPTISRYMREIYYFTLTKANDIKKIHKYIQISNTRFQPNFF